MPTPRTESSTFSQQYIAILNSLSLNFDLLYGVVEALHLLVAEGKTKLCSMIGLNIGVKIKL